MTALIIEKNINLMFFIKALLTQIEIEVFTSPNAQDGLKVLREHKNIHHIISDSKFTDMDSVEFMLEAASIQGKDSVTLVSPRQFFDFLGSALSPVNN